MVFPAKGILASSMLTFKNVSLHISWVDYTTKCFGLYHMMKSYFKLFLQLQLNQLLEILRSRVVIFIASNVTITVRILIRWWRIVGSTRNWTALWQQGSKNILQPNIVISRVANTMESKLITIVGSVNIQYLAYRKWKHTSIGIWTSKCKPRKIFWWHNKKSKESFDIAFTCILNLHGKNVF